MLPQAFVAHLSMHFIVEVDRGKERDSELQRAFEMT